MVETIKEFQAELRALREEMYQQNDYIDTKLVASYLDRLIISLENLADSLDIMGVELEALSGAESPRPVRAAGTKKAKPRKAAKKPAKKAKAGRRKGRR